MEQQESGQGAEAKYLWSESESPAGSHRTAEDDFVHVEWNMIMAPVTTERIAAPIYLPVRPAAEVIGEWREESPTKRGAGRG